MPIELLPEKLSQLGDLNPITDIPNLKFEKFSFRLAPAATSSFERYLNDKTRCDGSFRGAHAARVRSPE